MSTNYLEVATEQLQRGFKVAPVHPLEKRGVLWNQYRNPATTISEITQHAKDYPTHNVGVVGVRGIGNLCFLDIDADGVVEKIEQESGHKMPMTYTVQSSPARKPWKQHFYFTQTEHSVLTFPKQFNRRDVTKIVESTKSNAMHPTLYDLKGTGGGGFVVAAGCTREDGEIYTIMHDVPVVPIPDWLVDWLDMDRRRYQSELSKERQTQAKTAGEMPDNVRDVLQEQGDPSAFPIREVDIYQFLLWRAGTFASLGIERKSIEKLLCEQITKFCAGGTSYVEAHRDTIHNIAFSKSLRTYSNVNWFYRLGDKKKSALGGDTAIKTRKSLLIEAMQKLPDRITAEKGYLRLQKYLEGTGHTLDRGKAPQKALAEVRTLTGFTTEQTSEGWVWVRSPIKQQRAS